MKTKIFFLSLIFVLLVSFTVTAGTPRWTSGISINPSVSQSGDTMTFQTVVKADRKSTNVFTIVAGVDGKQLFKRKFSRLQPNKTRIVRFRWKALAGDHSAYFRIVPEGQSVKKANNYFLITKKFKVRKVTLPSLAPCREKNCRDDSSQDENIQIQTSQ